MAFYLNPEQPVGQELKRVLQEEMRSAAQHLRLAALGDGDEAVHEARKSVKKIRAVLRLGQGELGEIYDEKNRRFGEIGRTLSALRDAGAMVETFEELRKAYRTDVVPAVWTELRRFLLRRKKDTQQAVDGPTVFEEFPIELETLAEQVDDWPLRREEFSAIAPGVAKAFGRGRRAMKQSQKKLRPENFHEWRKRVKDHWYHVRLLRPVWSEMMDAYGGVLKDMQMLLGDDHNLTVLRELIHAEESLRRLLPLIENHQQLLRQRALLSGVRVYAAKPKQLTAMLELLWNSPSGRSTGQKDFPSSSLV